MTKTSFNPKVSTVRADDHATDKAKSGSAPKAASVPGDSYKSGNADPYKALVSGQPKAEETPIGEMLAEAGSAVNRRRQDPYQALIGRLMMGDADLGGPTKADFEGVEVPKLKQILKDLPDAPAWPIVERYAALEKMIRKLIYETDRSLLPSNACKMTPDELRALQDHREELVQSLNLCRSELASARRLRDIEEKEQAEKLAKDLAEDDEASNEV